MAEKQDGFDYILEMLEQYGCRNFKALKGGKDIRCGCPYHNPNGDSSAFKVRFPEDRAPFFHCALCHENGDLSKLVSFLIKVSYKKASRLLRKRTNVGRVSIDIISKTFDKICNTFSEYKIQVDSKQEKPKKSKYQAPMYEFLHNRSKTYHDVVDVDWVINKYSMYYCDIGYSAKRIIMPINIGGEYITYNDRSIYEDHYLKSLHPEGVDFENLVHGVDESFGKKNVIVVEGSYDMLHVMSFLKSIGYLKDWGCVNLMNAHMTETKASIIASAFDKAILLFDHDKAGLEGSKHAEKILSDMITVENRTSLIPKGLDPGKCLPSVLYDAIFKLKLRRKTQIDSILWKLKI